MLILKPSPFLSHQSLHHWNTPSFLHHCEFFQFLHSIYMPLSCEYCVSVINCLLSHSLNGSAKDLFVNLTSSIGTDVSVSALVFSILCRFFNVNEKRWSSEGLRPLSNSSPHAAHCLTQHLTMFGASLFVHPETLLLLPPVCVCFKRKRFISLPLYIQTALKTYMGRIG